MAIKHGGGWYTQVGGQKHSGNLLFCVSGHVNKPRIEELPTGVLLTDLIYEYAYGGRGHKKIKAIIPGGSSTPILRDDSIDGVRTDAHSLRQAGSAIGIGGVIVTDEGSDIPKVVE